MAICENFQSLEFVDRVSETQIYVGENSKRHLHVNLRD